ncbi:MAG: hypothetical protein U0R44_01945 [Candidatus Micrarchaeia archaeon]
MVSLAYPILREKIIPLGRQADYITARKLVAERGLKLPSNVLHDDYLASEGWKSFGSLYPAWARELLVYPEAGGHFRLGLDVEDAESRWVLPSEYVPAKALSKPGVGLLVDPGEIVHESGMIVVHPVSVTLIEPFIQVNGGSGRMDPATGIPLAIETASIVKKRYLCRGKGSGVVPIARFTYGHRVSESHIFAHSIPNEELGVAAASY